MVAQREGDDASHRNLVAGLFDAAAIDPDITFVDQPLPEPPATVRMVGASGQMVQAVATGMAEIAGNIAGTIAGAMAAPLTAAAATAHVDASEAVNEPRDSDDAAGPQGVIADGSAN